ncbi:zinc ribbon domain-containing protein [Salinicoccus sp. HZC-1]|uniref:zinc ribbon domain-containing protein n=1 Tax=Salinicoccus sp. HZC-1 TaxID=3385497 RepID=UPI00398A8475
MDSDVGYVKQFSDVLKYKCDIYARQLIVVNPHKTSQLCSSCQFDSGKKPLNIRQWSCTACSINHDRDINVAKNILNPGLGQALVK